MENLKSFFIQNKARLLTAYILLIGFIGFLLRFVSFGDIPCGFNQDEAFAAYETFSLLNYGIDSAGYHNPTYFVSWGSGMNVLESYLAIPFFAIFGPSATVFRLPMLVCSLICLPTFYSLLKEVFNKKVAVIGYSILCICPWHVMLSRWGLESNLAPSFLLFGFYFLVKGLKDNRLWLVSALMYGISLYSYSVTWIVVPFTLICVFVYLVVTNYKFSVKHLISSMAILFVLALPHILFMLINMNVMPEITTDYISIPKLVVMRDSEITLENLFNANNYYRVMNLLLGAGDSLIWNTISEIGMYYIISIPFILIGLVSFAKTAVEKFKIKRYDKKNVVFIGTCCSFLVALLFYAVNVNKANHMHMYTIIIIALGICKVLKHFSKYKTIFAIVIVAIYSISLINFGSTYFETYNDSLGDRFRYGVEECVAFVNEQNFETVNVDSSINYPQILFYDQTPTPEFISTREYSNYPSAFLNVKTFGKYTFGVDLTSETQYDAYIIPNGSTSSFPKEVYEIVTFNHYSVAYRK